MGESTQEETQSIETQSLSDNVVSESIVVETQSTEKETESLTEVSESKEVESQSIEVIEKPKSVGLPQSAKSGVSRKSSGKVSKTPSRASSGKKSEKNVEITQSTEDTSESPIEISETIQVEVESQSIEVI